MSNSANPSEVCGAVVAQVAKLLSAQGVNQFRAGSMPSSGLTHSAGLRAGPSVQLVAGPRSIKAIVCL
jgi:hypothetical protein